MCNGSAMLSKYCVYRFPVLPFIVVKIKSESYKIGISQANDPIPIGSDFFQISVYPIFSYSDSDFFEKNRHWISRQFFADFIWFFGQLYPIFWDLAKTEQIPSLFLMPIFCLFYPILQKIKILHPNDSDPIPIFLTMLPLKSPINIISPYMEYLVISRNRSR